MKRRLFLLFVCTLIVAGAWAQKEKKALVTQPRLERVHHVNRLHHGQSKSMKPATPLTRSATNTTVRGMHKVQANSHGVITERPDGELKRYTRTGQRFYRPSDYELKLGETTGEINIVFDNDGQHVYLQGPVSGLDAENWVAGTIEGNTITVPLGQKTNYYPEYDTTTELRFLWTTYDDNEGVLTFGVDEDTEAQFIINEDGTIALQNSSQGHLLAIIWSDNNDWSGFGEFECVYVPQNMVQTVPYEQTFFSEADFNRMTVLDANNDTKTWRYFYPVAMYEYSYAKSADDWLITPGIELKAGKRYSFDMDVAESSEEYGPERIEVKMGVEPMPSSFNTIIIPATELVEPNFVTLSNDVFTVEKDGVYYFGVHAISDVYKENIFLRSINIEEAVNEASPAGVENLRVTADPNGMQKATIIFDAPMKSLLGIPLSPVDLTARIYRDGKNIGTVEMKPGQKGIVFEDDFADESEPYFGYITYAVVAYSAAARGAKVEVEAFVGADYPMPVEEFTICDTDSGLKFSWSPVPEEGWWGGPVNPETVGYDIHRMSYNDNDGMYYVAGQLNAETIFGTSYVYEPYPQANQGAQGFHYYAVIPVSNVTGKDEYTYTLGEVLEGAPDVLPYHESITGHKLSHFLTWSGSAEGVYLYYSNISSDGDDEAMKLESEFAGSKGCLETGKIALGDATSPKLIFDAFSSNAANKVKVMVVTPDGVKHVMKTFNPAAEYETLAIDLKEFASERWVRIFCEVEYADVSYVNFDNIRVVDVQQRDLQISVNAPEEVAAGQTATLKVTVANHGAQPLEAYAVQVKADEKVIFFKEINETLGFYESRIFDVDYTPSIDSKTGEVTLIVTVANLLDGATGSPSAETVINIIEPVASAPENLTYAYDEGVVTLSWNAPGVAVKQVTEDFESYTPWTIGNTLGQWTMVDGDKSLTKRLFSDVPLPVENKAMAYTVWNYDGTNVVEGHNSNKCLAALLGMTEDGKYAAPNDWLISPLLSGTAQTISFWTWGRKYYTEKYNVLYSTTDTDIDSFVALNEQSYVANSGEWEKVSVDLPEGAKYFAIQRVSTSGGSTWLFGIDDITYTKQGSDAVAYNIYINGMKSATVPSSTLSFVMEHLSLNSHEMAVTAVYPDGMESRPVKVNVPVYKTTPIVPPAGGEKVKMYLKGVDYVMESPMAQELEAVFFDNEVYLKGMRRTSPESWVVGQIADGKVTFAPWHTIGTKAFQNQEVGIFMEGIVPETSIIGALVMDYDAETREMWTDNQYIVFNASMSSVLFDQIVKDPVITADIDDQPEVVVPPATLQTYEGNVVTSLYYEHKQASWSGEIGFDGDDCYFRGSFYYLPESWIKGHVDGNRIIFPANQFMGICSGFDSYMSGLIFNHSNGQMTFGDFVLVWNPETQCYEGENAASFSVSRDYFAGIEIEENFRFYGGTPPPAGIEEITTSQPDLLSTSKLYNLAGQRINATHKGIVIMNGKTLLLK